MGIRSYLLAHVVMAGRLLLMPLYGLRDLVAGKKATKPRDKRKAEADTDREKPESPKDPFMLRVEHIWKATKEEIQSAYPMASWRFVSEDIGAILKGLPTVKEVIVTTRSGAVEHRLVKYWTEITETEEGRSEVIKCSLRDNRTALERAGERVETPKPGDTPPAENAPEPSGEQDAPTDAGENPAEEKDSPEEPEEDPEDGDDEPEDSFKPEQWFAEHERDLKALTKQGTANFVIPKDILPESEADRLALMEEMAVHGIRPIKQVAGGIKARLAKEEEF